MPSQRCAAESRPSGNIEGRTDLCRVPHRERSAESVALTSGRVPFASSCGILWPCADLEWGSNMQARPAVSAGFGYPYHSIFSQYTCKYCPIHAATSCLQCRRPASAATIITSACYRAASVHLVWHMHAGFPVYPARPDHLGVELSICSYSGNHLCEARWFAFTHANAHVHSQLSPHAAI